MRPAVWAMVLGGVGLTAGFFGPMLLNPDANQGPMLGLFGTGPAGVVLGLVLGFLASVSPLSERARRAALAACAAALILGTLWASLPMPVYRYRDVDVEVLSCAPAASRREAAVAEWEKRTVQPRYAGRAGWKEDFERMFAAGGSVLRVRVARERGVYERRRPWDRGTLDERPWQDSGEERDYYAEGGCAAFPAGRRFVSAARGALSRQWPPELLPNVLGLQTVTATP